MTSTLSSYVMIQDNDHEYKEIGINIIEQRLLVNKIEIGENCFIGSGVKILAGTTLGNQCIVGSNAVVRGIFPDYSVIVGIPAKIVKSYNNNTKSWERVYDNE